MALTVTATENGNYSQLSQAANGGLNSALNGSASVFNDPLTSSSVWVANNASSAATYSSNGATFNPTGSLAVLRAGNNAWSPALGTAGQNILLSAQCVFVESSSLPTGYNMGMLFQKDTSNFYEIYHNSGALRISKNGTDIKSSSYASSNLINGTWLLTFSIDNNGVLSGSLYSGTSSSGTPVVTVTVTDMSIVGPFQFCIEGGNGVVAKNALITAPVNVGNISSYKWFSLQDNKLDGTYHPIDSIGSNEIGWWGTTLSDGTGVLSSSPALTITDTRSIQTLQVAGDSNLNEYPVDFTYTLYNGSTVLKTVSVTGNTQTIWNQQLDKVYDITKMVLTVSKVNKANRTVKILDAANVYSFSRSDTMTPKTVDVLNSNNRPMNSTDTVLVKGNLSETHNITVKLNKTDLILPKAADSSFMKQYAINRSDVLTPKTVDTSSVKVNMTRTDILKPKTNEAKTGFTVKLTKTDTALVARNIEQDHLTADLYGNDIFKLKTDEISRMTNIHTVMDGDNRQVYGKVEITYSDPFIDQSVSVIATASTTGKYTDVNDVKDNRIGSQSKWFKLNHNKLDGTFKLLPSVREPLGSVGWWGTNISDVSGVLSAAETITLQFNTPRPFFALSAYGDDLLNCYPVNFKIDLYDSNNTILYTENVIGNNQVAWKKTLTNSVSNVSKQVLTITSINTANDVAKINELYTSVDEAYTHDDVIEISLLEEQMFEDVTIPIGNISANEIDITFYNDNRKFDPGNKKSPLYGLLKRNRKVKAWLGSEVIPGSGIIEWYQLGVFWTLDWKTPYSTVEATVTARDRLEMLRDTNFIKSQVYQNASLYSLAETILIDAGLTAGTDYILDNALKNITVPWAWFDQMSHRAALAKIAETGLARIYCDRNGAINVVIFVPQPYPMYTFNNDKSIIDADHPLAWSQLVNYVQIEYTPMVLGATGQVFNSTDPISIPANSTVTEMFRFNNVPCSNVSAPTITMDTGISVVSTAIYAWGALVTFQNTNAAAKNVTSVTFNGQPLQKGTTRSVTSTDPTSVRDNGKLSFSAQGDFIQSQSLAQTIADNILATYMNPRKDIKMEVRGNIALQLGDRITAPDYVDGDGNVTNSDYFIIRQTLTWNGALSGAVDGQKIGGN